MSKNMKLDSNWDVIPGRGLTRIGNVEYVAQNCKSRLQTSLGECFNKTKGVPWTTSILGSTTITDATLKEIVANSVKSTPDVLSIKSMEVKRENRKATISFEAISVYGSFTIEV